MGPLTPSPAALALSPLEALFYEIYEPQDRSVRRVSSVEDLRSQAAKAFAKAELFARLHCHVHSIPAVVHEQRVVRVRPGNFGNVHVGRIYRSQYPVAENFTFLRGLGLKTILTLVPEPIPQAYAEFMHTIGIRHLQIPLPANKGGIAMEQCAMSRVLSVLLDRSNWPLLIHCNKGKHRTGCTVASFRKVLGVRSDGIIDEYRAYSYPKSREWDQRFIESFDARTTRWLARLNGFEIQEESDDVTVLPQYMCARL